ncbi:ScyD/ScyE family protein [Dyadobacter luticola]|uniref:ScyD/ScyE family protein n=1 Tax=Dyadobacter luticola TaxID=1979387 RepID=A0A5R9L2I6_9BACT|nr:ScyD/ScyE family protein [Dyadobacter luticola]TLV02559.1 ScyD/ScyE family protein [Dyadobacter luticola]
MKKRFLQSTAVYLLLLLGVFACTDHEIPGGPIPEPTALMSTPFASGLRAPLGIDKDDKGNFWVSEIGTGNNDGAVVMIAPDGTKTTFATGFNSAGGPEGPEGMSHVLYHDGKLYILHGIDGKLYVADVAGFKTGDAPRPISSFKVYEYGNEIRAMHLATPDNSNLYALTMGPDGDIYMTDAGSNAIFRRDKTVGTIKLYAKLPKVGTGPIVDAVPTGIVWDGKQFLISTLSGGPFVPGSAKIFAVDNIGNVSVYKSGFTTLTHIALTANNKPLVLKFAEFDKGMFKPGSGAVMNEDGTPLLSGLTMATDIKRTGDREFVLVNMFAGTVDKLTY